MEQLYLVAIMPPEPLRSILAQIQESYRAPQWHKRIAPHITLIHPAASETPEQLIAALTPIAQVTAPFTIQLNGVSYFPKQRSVIFAQVTESAELMHLHKIIKQALPFIPLEKRPFHPHLTLSNRLTAQDFLRIWPKLSKIRMQYRWECREFILFKLNHATGWEPIQTFPLITT